MNGSRMTRRVFLATVPALAIRTPTTAAPPDFVELERSAGGRLGVAVYSSDSGQELGHRLDERFGMCSTFKLPLAAVTLREIDRGRGEEAYPGRP